MSSQGRNSIEMALDLIEKYTGEIRRDFEERKVFKGSNMIKLVGVVEEMESIAIDVKRFKH